VGISQPQTCAIHFSMLAFCACCSMIQGCLSISPGVGRTAASTVKLYEKAIMISNCLVTCSKKKTRSKNNKTQNAKSKKNCKCACKRGSIGELASARHRIVPPNPAQKSRQTGRVNRRRGGRFAAIDAQSRPPFTAKADRQIRHELMSRWARAWQGGFIQPATR